MENHVTVVYECIGVSIWTNLFLIMNRCKCSILQRSQWTSDIIRDFVYDPKIDISKSVRDHQDVGKHCNSDCCRKQCEDIIIFAVQPAI